jgi:hypothetical protein
MAFYVIRQYPSGKCVKVDGKSYELRHHAVVELI